MEFLPPYEDRFSPEDDTRQTFQFPEKEEEEDTRQTFISPKPSQGTRKETRVNFETHSRQISDTDSNHYNHSIASNHNPNKSISTNPIIKTMKTRKTLAIKKESDQDLVNKKSAPKARISMKAIMKKQQESVDLDNSVQNAAKNKFKILFRDIKDGKLTTL